MYMRVSESIRRDRLVPVVSLLLLALLSVTPSIAKDKKQASDEEVRVLANLPLPDIKVNQMFAQQWGDKVYLYLHQPAEDVYALVDVTKPEKPTLVSRSGVKGTAAEGPVGNSPLAITATQETQKPAAVAELPTQTINFTDTTNPKEPKTVKTFKGVTCMYSDDARKLVYLVNAEGLWIVRHRNTRPLPVCTGGTTGPNCPAIPAGPGM
jgi:hypothetical protein